MLAACCTGNYVIILAAVALLLFLLINDHSDNSLISKLLFAGAVLGLIISHSVVRLVDTTHHKGPGFVDYGSEDYGNVDVEKVSESEYKRHEYTTHGMLLGIGVLFWFLIADYAKGITKQEKEKAELEKSWVRMILNPNNVQEIRRHPEHYRDDFKQWIKEIQPDLLLPAEAAPNVKPPINPAI